MRAWQRMTLFACAIVLCLGLSLAGAAAADQKDAVNKVRTASLMLHKMMAENDSDVFRDMLKKAKAVALFPDMFKAGFILGGKGGLGLVLARTAEGSWTAPAFFGIGGASFGLQIGAQSSDVLLVFMNQKGLNGLMANRLTLGADAAIAAGPVGRRAEAGLTAAKQRADVYSFAMSKGIFAGVSLEGAVIDFAMETTANYYGRPYTLTQILVGNEPSLPESAVELIKVLNKYSH